MNKVYFYFLAPSPHSETILGRVVWTQTSFKLDVTHFQIRAPDSCDWFTDACYSTVSSL